MSANSRSSLGNRSCYEVSTEISQPKYAAQLGGNRSGSCIRSPRREEQTAERICGSHGARRPCSSTSERDRIRRPGKKVRNQRKRQAKKAQEQRVGGKRPPVGDALQSERARKRRYAGPARPTYIPRADLLEKDQSQLVDEILMRMTPRQLETRCTHNKVHFLLSEQQRCNPFWSQPAWPSHAQIKLVIHDKSGKASWL